MPTKALWMFGGKSLKYYIPNWRQHVRAAKRSKHSHSGSESLSRKWRLEPLTCFTRIMQIGSQTNKTLARFTAQIFAQRSLNTRLPKKSRFAILHPFRCQHLFV